VEFRNADDGGATFTKPNDADYLSWTDTRIRVRVPSNGADNRPAGSGTVRVTTAAQLSATSAASLAVPYALTNVKSTMGNLVQRPNHVNQNGRGGLTYRFGPNLVSNAAASAALQRALATWRCNSGVNWGLGAPVSANTIADDDQNVVAFDNASDPLPERVLGRTTTYYNGCFAPNGEVVFFVSEVDMQYDDAANFQFGPALALGTLNQVDFETVALHELGHAQQLGHVIRPNAVMHFAIGRGLNARTLNPTSDLAGGRRVLRERSFRQLGCGPPPMLPAPLTSLAASSSPGTGPVVTWTTENECFLNGFVVERSVGADTTAWERVGTVASGRAGGQYQLADLAAPAGLRFYRLRLSRPDGSLDNAAPQAVTSDGQSPAVVIFPNPLLGPNLNLQYRAATAGNVAFRIYDEVGREHRRTTIGVQAGLSVVALDATGLRPGFYILRWVDESGKGGSAKFVRQ
jgi:hypothetical protein